jgi:hypothetical protein
MSTIYETFDYGYDPSIPEPVTPEPPPLPATLPPTAMVNTEWLPPVGHQTVPNCYVWASAYGLVTYWAGQSSGTVPASPASPDYTYIQVEIEQGLDNTCIGGKITNCLEWLVANKGTPSLAAAPDLGGATQAASCRANWNAYRSGTIEADPSFAIQGFASTTVKQGGSDGLDYMRAVLLAGFPLAYGTSLYTDFGSYTGTPTPYVGSGIWAKNKNTGKRAGHCMLIVGYDDTYPAPPPSAPPVGPGAVRIQNSFGTSWGEDGFVWMAYDTFKKTAQDLGFYIICNH